MALQIIGAGFGRTGTLSLKTALEQLGFPCYHMVECLPKGPSTWKLWEEALSGKPDWDTIFEGFAATVDFPACTSYAALAEYYPQAKVILSVRDPEKWYESVQNTIFTPHWMEYLPSSEAGPFMKATINDYFEDRMHDREFLIQRFHEHSEAVKEVIPPERLLVFEVAQGWGPLCDFLECDTPDGDFPHVNDTKQTQDIISAIIAEGFQAVLGYRG
ncbi:MAG: sulfotransferase family protein [Verrucomicrobiales bacterium]